jgi:hypothetical protein
MSLSRSNVNRVLSTYPFDPNPGVSIVVLIDLEKLFVMERSRQANLVSVRPVGHETRIPI